MGPITFVAGGSARREAGATGLKGLRIAGWVAYGVSLALAVALVYLGIFDLEPPTGFIIAAGGFGALSLTFFSIDAFSSHAEASLGTVSEGPAYRPTLVLARERDGSTIPGLGVAARF